MISKSIQIFIFYFMNTNTYTALVTPFKNNQIDEKAFSNLIEFQIKNDIDGIVMDLPLPFFYIEVFFSIL